MSQVLSGKQVNGFLFSCWREPSIKCEDLAQSIIWEETGLFPLERVQKGISGALDAGKNMNFTFCLWSQSHSFSMSGIFAGHASAYISTFLFRGANWCVQTSPVRRCQHKGTLWSSDCKENNWPKRKWVIIWEPCNVIQTHTQTITQWQSWSWSDTRTPEDQGHYVNKS